MKRIYTSISVLLVLFVVVLLLGGCGGQPATSATKPQTPQPATPKTETTPAAELPVSPAETTSAVVKGSITDCSFLSLDDVKSVIGIDMKEASSYPRAKGCSKSWIDLQTSMDATVALQVTQQASTATQQDLTMAAGTFKKIGQIGDYDTSWDENGAAINFGKGEYKFQVQCMGDSCSEEKAVALAKIVVSRVS